MTDALDFGRLESVPVRTAWVNEATVFTPWLAQNLDRLGDELGIPLELVQTEFRVTRFSADILARNAADGSTVLIENQLEESDHGHLGQIMTYLAGTEAQTVVWVAPKFCQEHRSAIRWLNRQTPDPFSFFAVEVRVVRIGTSPLTPVFEIIEQPNDWERTVQEQARQDRQLGENAAAQKAFWAHLIARFPSEQHGGQPAGRSWRWREPTTSGFVVAQYISHDKVGVFIRGRRGVPTDVTKEELAPYQAKLEQALSAKLDNRYLFIKRLKIDTSDRANWDRMADWLHEQADAYVATLGKIVGGSNPEAARTERQGDDGH